MQIFFFISFFSLCDVKRCLKIIKISRREIGLLFEKLVTNRTDGRKIKVDYIRMKRQWWWWQKRRHLLKYFFIAILRLFEMKFSSPTKWENFFPSPAYCSVVYEGGRLRRWRVKMKIMDTKDSSPSPSLRDSSISHKQVENWKCLQEKRARGKR
jgi:hypothetical protein